MHRDVVTELRAICETTLTSLSERTSVPYTDDLAFDASAQYLLVSAGSLVKHRRESRRGRRATEASAEPPEVEVDPGALRVLENASSLPELDVSQLRYQSFLFYAAVVGNDPHRRVAFVDKWNPYKAGLSGQLATFFGDRLRRIEGPLLIFERTFDMVITDTSILVLDSKAFEGVFRDIDAMRARFPVWSDAAIAAIPFDDPTAERLRAQCGEGGRLARQLRGLYERGVFGLTFTTDALRVEMERQRLDAGRMIIGGKLSLTDTDIPVVLKLLDEKLYTGWYTETPWDVATRTRRST
jgi:hypothetical protein